MVVDQAASSVQTLNEEITSCDQTLAIGQSRSVIAGLAFGAVLSATAMAGMVGCWGWRWKLGWGLGDGDKGNDERRKELQSRGSSKSPLCTRESL